MPCFCCAGRCPLAKNRPLPLLRFGCFCRRQRLSCAAHRPFRCSPGPAGPPPYGGSGPFTVSSPGGFAGTVRQNFAAAAQPAPRRSSLWLRAPAGAAAQPRGHRYGRRAGFDDKSKERQFVSYRAQLLLRLADFCGAPRRALAKTGALRQTQLPVSSTGCGRCVCPCSASAVSAAGPQAALGSAANAD